MLKCIITFPQDYRMSCICATIEVWVISYDFLITLSLTLKSLIFTGELLLYKNSYLYH